MSRDLEKFFQKIDSIKKQFSLCSSAQEKYELLIELGRKLPSMDLSHKLPENIVSGCQSTLYLYSYIKEGKMSFEISSDALISAGMAALLKNAYEDLPPDILLKYPPTFLKELGIDASLSPSRSNGLYYIHLRMQQDALKFLLKKT